ncbi:MAG TPA: hypothetical protein DDZ88_29985 [Verrucomicrobiales bacterium]|nr:hypothetical protein [Verrucomicrobiales bacterium]
MTKMRKKIDINQGSIFDILRQAQDGNLSLGENAAAGSLDIDRQFREAVSLDLKGCPLSRYGVAGKMSELLGQDITAAMLNSWTAESHNGHRFPAIFLPAFCAATGQSRAMQLVGRASGSFLLPGSDALRAEIRRLDEEIASKQCEKKKRLMFLKEVETKR